MGQAPASGRISLRTVPRNFPGRSGTKEDQVYLCSPETATASALTGKITDPRTLDMAYPHFQEPESLVITSYSIHYTKLYELYRTNMRVTAAMSALPPLMEFIGGIGAIGAIWYASIKSYNFV